MSERISRASRALLESLQAVFAFYLTKFYNSRVLAEERIVANREIDDVIAKDHIELSKRDQRELFEMFEEDRMVTPDVGEAALDEKVFRFAVYETNDSPLGEDESSDIVDIPINCDELADDVIDEQINRAMDKVEEGDVDVSQDELPSDSSTSEQDNDEPPTVTTSNARRLEFEYENAKNTEIKEEQKMPNPEQNNQPGWEIADDRENEKPLPPVSQTFLELYHLRSTTKILPKICRIFALISHSGRVLCGKFWRYSGTDSFWHLFPWRGYGSEH